MEGDKIMQEGKKQTLIVYFEPTQVYLYDITGNYFLLKFPSDVVNNQEIVDIEKFSELFEDLFTQYEVANSHVLIVLSQGLTFEKILSENISPIDRNKEAKEFTDIVPFEEVLSHIYKLSKTEKIIAVNKKLCDDISEILKKLQFSVTIIPLSIIQDVIVELTNNLDLKIILDRADSLKQYSLLSPEEIEFEKTTQSKKSDKTRLLILGGIFFVLLAILALLLITNVFLVPKTPVASIVHPTQTQR